MFIRLTVLLLSLLTSTSVLAADLALLPDKFVDSMGADAYEQIKQQTPISKNRAATAHVQCVASALTREVGGDWEVNLFASPEVNAFALPGGKIGVNEGLLEVTKNQDQLAAVIGHEIGHVQAEHPNQRITTSLISDLGLRALASFTGIGDSQIGMAALGLGTQYGVLLPFSRSQEEDADLLGLEYMARAGFNPDQAAALWRNMRAAGGSSPPEFLSTHPSASSRIEDLQQQAPRYRDTYQQARRVGKRPSC